MSAGPYSFARWRQSRYWAILDGEGALVALVVYRKGAAELLRRLNNGG